MSQNSLVIANGSGAAVRAAINNALNTLVTNNSGASAPSTTYGLMFWGDTTANLFKLRNIANSAWIEVGKLDLANLSLASLYAVNTFTARQEWKKGADIAAAATVTPGTDGNSFSLTGNTGITAIASTPAGTRLQFVFTGTPIVTHNGTSLILQNAQNRQMKAGDVWEVLSLGSGNYRETGYHPLTTPGPLHGHLWGLTLTNNAVDPTNDIDIAAGETMSDDASLDDVVLMKLASTLTKQLDFAWAVGSGQGGLDIGTIANGTYHVWCIKRPDTAVVDAVFSRNPGVQATITVTIASPGVVTWTDHGLQAGSTVVFSTTGALPTGITAGTRYYVIATGLTTTSFQISATEGGAAINTSGTQSGVHTGVADPVLPANYTKKRRIGSILREALAIVGFIQDGEYFRRKASVLDINAANPGTAAVTATLSAPIGINVHAIIDVVLDSQNAGDNNNALHVSDLAANDEAASQTVAPLGSGGQSDGTTSSLSGGQIVIRTNRSAQIRYRLLKSSGVSTVVRIAMTGWRDARGRNN